jgi:nitroreductase
MRRLENGRPVSEADVRTLIEAASKGATGGNRQQVRWLVVRDPELKRQIGEHYRHGAAIALKAYEEDARTNPSAARMLRSAWHLADHMGEAPVLILACASGNPQFAGASVFPGVQNLMLAARALGLGTTLTTIHRHREKEIKELLGIPEDVTVHAVIPVGYPLGRWGEAPRKPPEEITYRDRWGEPAGF